MDTPVRIALVVGGVAVAIYGLLPLFDSSLAPSWWWRAPNAMESHEESRAESDAPKTRMQSGTIRGPACEPEPLQGREWLSAMIATGGSAVVAFDAWPCRRDSDARGASGRAW